MNLISKKIKIFFLLLLSVLIYSQTLSSNLSKDRLALGEKATFRVSVNNLHGRDVISMPKNELLPFHFEETSDNIKKSFDLYTRTIEFQVFEEGKFNIPELEFSVNGKIYKTIPYQILVYNPVNANDKINDIMNNKQVDLGIKDYWELYKFYVLAFLIFLAALFLFFGLFKNGVFKKNTKQEHPVHQTLSDLKSLEKKQYAESGNFRLFYVELIDITRAFLSKQYHLPADVLLTDDLIEMMKKTNKISIENEKIVEEIFLRGDLVKFAKVFPNHKMMNTDFQKIYDFVERSTADIEAEHLREMH